VEFDTAELRWLHISDFHFKSGESYDRDVVLEAFFSSLATLVDRAGKPDLVFATGDVGHSGKPKEYDGATAFFDRLLKETGLERSQLYVVPGNHDINRDAGKGLARSLQSTEEADNYFDPSDSLLHVKLRQEAFAGWYNDYFKGVRVFPENSTAFEVETVQVRKSLVSILPVNSAAFCFDDQDVGKLWVGRRCLARGLAALAEEPSALKFALLHHPFSWLHADESRSIKAELQAAADLILTGHLHESDIENVLGVSGDAVRLSAGAMYQTQKWPNTAMFCGVEGRMLKVLPIRYESKPRPVWTVDPSLFPNQSGFLGQYTLSRGGDANDNGSTGTALMAKPAAAVYPSRIEFEQDLFVTPSGRMIYVEPRLMTRGQAYSLDEDSAAEPVTIEAMLVSEDSYIVESRAEYGGTSLAKRLIAEFTERGVVAVLKDARELPTYKKKLEPLFKDVRKSGAKTVIVLDNFDPERDERLIKELSSGEWFDRAIAIYSSRGLRPASFLDTAETKFSFTTVHLWTCSRDDIRQMTSILFDTEDDVFLSRIVDKVYADLLALCIPLTPSNVIMYLRILHKEGEFHPLNRVDIVGQYLTELLRRPSDAYADSFSAKNKLDVLSAFAFELYQKRQNEFDDRFWLDFCAKYQSATLTEFDSNSLLDELISSRIMVRWSGTIVVKYSFFSTYFLGRYIAHKEAVLGKFIEEQEYLRVPGVVDVITGISSDNTLVVKALTNSLESHLEYFSETYIEAGLDPLEGAIWISDYDDEEFWEKISEKIERGPRPSSEIDEVKTSLLAEARTSVQEISYTKFVEAESSLFYVGRLLSDALRNADDVSGDLKIAALDAVLRSHLVAFQIGAVFAPVLAKKRTFSWGSVTFIDFYRAAEDLNPESVEAKNAITVALNREIATSAVRDLGTSKLSGVFKAREALGKPVGFMELANFSCLISAKGQKWAETATKIIERTDKNAFYLRAMLVMLMRELEIEVLQAKDREQLRRLVALVHAKRSFKKQVPGAKAVNKILEILKREEGEVGGL
jgi:predicted phosphodiesterase